MSTGPFDLAQVRLDNALALFDEFVRQTAKHADAATLRGLERRFAERVQIQPSYWSQIKSRSRQIGERLARQFEHLCHKPRGWLDVPHPSSASEAIGEGAVAANGIDEALPRDSDERFIVGLVLTYYRRHPQRARSALLDLLGEVLLPQAASAGVSGPRGASTARGASVAEPDESRDLWLRSSQGVAPLKRRK